MYKTRVFSSYVFYITTTPYCVALFSQRFILLLILFPSRTKLKRPLLPSPLSPPHPTPRVHLLSVPLTALCSLDMHSSQLKMFPTPVGEYLVMMHFFFACWYNPFTSLLKAECYSN